MIKSVFDLDVFKVAHETTLIVYRLSSKWPAEERFGLASQIRRAASSIAMNLAEGSARRSSKDSRHFIVMAMGSCRELQYQLLLARDLEYLAGTEYEALFQNCDRIEKMLYKYHASLQD